MNKIFFDRPTVNIVTISLLSFVGALQVLIVFALVSSFIPIAVPALVHKLYPLSLYAVHLKRDTTLYHAWIAVALGLQGLFIFLYRKRLGDHRLWRSLLPYICTMAVIVYVQIFFVFKILLWNNPGWAGPMLYLFLGLGIWASIFWPEFWQFLKGLWTKATGRPIPWAGRLFMDAGVISILIFLVFAPDLAQVLARMFSYDKFYHLDSFIVAPAWAHHHGLVLNKDVTSEYSLMVPIIFDGLMKMAGGFSYGHAVGIMIALCALYYFLLYGLCRYWTNSFWLSFFAVVLSIKLQFFHWGVIPLIWIYPSATPLRFLPDVFFLFFILRFTQNFSLRWLCAASVICGLGLLWTMDVGIYMYATWVFAAAALFSQKGIKILPKIMALGLLPWGIALGVLNIFYGPSIWDNQFWRRDFEFASLFLQGWGALPIDEGLKDKQFFAFCMGFIMPLVYVSTLLYSMGMFWFRQSRPHLWMILICVYGLGLYHYFIHRSGVTSYYAVVIPFIFVVLFWAQLLINRCSLQWQYGIKLLLCVWVLAALLTGYLFTYYPNSLNLSDFDWSSEKKFYDANFDFNRDAVLIDDLTSPGERVALISSFETKILMQANRPPYFYYFPMIESEHMQGDKLRGTYLHTYARLERTLRQLQEQKPLHLFIQTRLFEGPEAQSYEEAQEGFKQLMAYIRLHYQYQIQGQYLTALQIK